MKKSIVPTIDKIITIAIKSPPESFIGITLIDLVGVGGGRVLFGLQKQVPIKNIKRPIM